LVSNFCGESGGDFGVFFCGRSGDRVDRNFYGGYRESDAIVGSIAVVVARGIANCFGGSVVRGMGTAGAIVFVPGVFLGLVGVCAAAIEITELMIWETD
jgi:hypothetical protein